MKYFTPQLFRRGNSSNAAVANAAEAAWESATQRYRDYLTSISSGLTPEVKRLATGICLHDGSIVRFTDSSVTVRLDQVVYSIEFELDQLAHQTLHGSILNGYPFSSEHPHWLYDELRLIKPGVYLFEVLLSTGQILRYRFQDVSIWELTVPKRSIEGQIYGSELKELRQLLSKLRKLAVGASTESSGSTSKNGRGPRATSRNKSVSTKRK